MPPTPNPAKLGRDDLRAALGLLAFTLLLQSPILFGGRSFYSEDVQAVFGPLRTLYRDALLGGEIPFWNVWGFSGSPLYENPESAVFYPGSLIFLLPLVPALKVSVLVHTFLAGFFAHLCFRKVFRTGPLAAFLGAVVFAFSSYYPHHIVHHRDVVTVPWLPLAVLMADRVFVTERSRLIPAAGLAVVLAVQLFAGAPQTCLYTMSLVGTLMLWKGGRMIRAGEPGRAFSSIGLAALATGLSVGVYAVQMLPATTLVDESFRSGGVTWEYASYLSLLPPQGATSLFLPHLFGRWGVDWWGRYNCHETLLYVGILPLLLWIAAWRCRRSLTGAGYLTVVAVLALVLAMGKWTPLYRVLYEAVPGYDMFRVPSRFILVFCFAAAGLTALGLEGITRGLREPRRVRRSALRWAAVVSSLIGLGWGALVLLPETCRAAAHRVAALVKGSVVHAERRDLYDSHFSYILEKANHAFTSELVWQAGSVAVVILSLWAFLRALRGARSSSAVLTAVLLLDLAFFSLGAPCRHTVPDREVNAETPLTAFLRENVGDARIDERLSPTVKWNRFVPYHLRAVDGRNLSLYPTERYRPVLEMLDADHPGLYDLLRVRYVVTGPGDPAPAGLVEVFEHGGEQVFTNPGILPAVWFAPRARRAVGREEIYAWMDGDGFDPRALALYEGEARETPGGGPGECRARVLSFSAHEVAYRVYSENGGLLVTAERWYPGWRVFVDDLERPVVRVNAVLRGVSLPAGEHRVVFSYREERFSKGLLISGISLAILIGLLVLGVVTGRRR